MRTQPRSRKRRLGSTALACLLSAAGLLATNAVAASAATTALACDGPAAPITIKRTIVVTGSKRAIKSTGANCADSSGSGILSLVKSTTTLTGPGLDADLPPDQSPDLVPGLPTPAGQWWINPVEIGGFQTLCHGGTRRVGYQFDAGTVVMTWQLNGITKTSAAVVRAEVVPPDDGTLQAFGLFPCTPFGVAITGTIKSGLLKGGHFEEHLLLAQDPATTTGYSGGITITDGPQTEPTDQTGVVDCLTIPTAKTVGPTQPGPAPTALKLKVSGTGVNCIDTTGSGITGATALTGTLAGTQDSDFANTVAGERPFAGTLTVVWNALNPTTGRPWTSKLTGQLTYSGPDPVDGQRFAFQGHVTAGKGLYADAHVDLTVNSSCSPLFGTATCPPFFGAQVNTLSLHYPWITI